MSAANINRVVLTGNLTFDPELRTTNAGTSVCRLRVAVTGRRKNPTTGAWEDKSNYFDVIVWAGQGENCARHLAKGRPVAIDGRLDWSEWTDDATGKKRSRVDIVADYVQFLGAPAGQRQDAGDPDERPADGDIPF